MEKDIDDIENQKPEFLLPSGTPIIGFHYLNNWVLESVKNVNIPKQKLPDYYITGQQTTSYTLIVEHKKTGIIGAALKPTALWQWFKIPMQNLTNRVKKIEEVITEDTQSFLNQYQLAPTIEDKIHTIESFLINLSSKIQTKPSLIDQCLDIIFSTKGCVTPKELTRITGLSERSLQLEFKKQIGVSPLQYARIIRFNNLFMEIAKPRQETDLLFLASIYNYYDTSHLYKDFIKFTGIAPTSFSLEKFKLLEELVIEIPYLIQVQN
ncbi:MAG: AraC family transcriptional regulator [Confluentibacter sp.]|nr:AraC family transcriptional regulator [Confluentibacter sp.]